MSLGELAWHIASAPGLVASVIFRDEFVFAEIPPPPPVPGTKEEILRGFESSLAVARRAPAATDEKTAAGHWTLKSNGKTVFAMPRIAFLRMVLLNHGYHHRGQLTV